MLPPYATSELYHPSVSGQLLSIDWFYLSSLLLTDGDLSLSLCTFKTSFDFSTQHWPPRNTLAPSRPLSSIFSLPFKLLPNYPTDPKLHFLLLFRSTLCLTILLILVIILQCISPTLLLLLLLILLYHNISIAAMYSMYVLPVYDAIIMQVAETSQDLSSVVPHCAHFKGSKMLQ